MGKSLSYDFILRSETTASKGICMVNCLSMSRIAFLESKPSPTAYVSSLPNASQFDYAILFHQQKKVSVGPVLSWQGLFAAEPIERYYLVTYFKGEGISSSEGKLRYN